MDAPFGSDPHSRFEKIDKVALLAQCPLFAGLSQWELRSISQLMRLVEYHKDEAVYSEGGEAEAFFVIVSGRFEATVADATKKKVLAYLRRGDYFGEMSLLTGQPHSATLRALSDSMVLVIKKDDFKKTIEHNATISLELSRRLSARLKVTESRARPLFKSDVVSVHGTQPRLVRSFFSLNLAASLFDETHQRTVWVDLSTSSDEPALGVPGARTALATFHDIDSRPPEIMAASIHSHHAGFDVMNLSIASEGREEALLIALLNHLALDHRFILLNLPDELGDTVMKALSQSDQLFFITDSHLNSMTEAKDTLAEIQDALAFPAEKISLVIQEAVFGAETTSSMRVEMFGSRRCFSLPLSTVESADAVRPVATEDADSEYLRRVRHMARFLSGNLVGLALGSGAAFGLAHVGVLKVLERERIPVDIIAGSSIGGLIGSLYAVGMSATEVEKAAMEIDLKLLIGKLADISIFPIRGLMHGVQVSKHFKKHLGNKTFEHCRIPLKITGANLTTRQSFVFDSGSVSEAVRASIAIPAIFKPVFRHGDTVVDGGILNPLPVNILRQSGANKVIAVNVFPTTKDLMEKRLLRQEALEKSRETANEQGWLAQARWKMSGWVRRAFFPNIFDILMSTIQSMEAEIADIEGQQADVLLRPVIPDSSWVDFFKPAPVIKRGEEETLKLLPKIKALVSQQTN